MNQNIIKYLIEYKGKYSRDILIGELLKAGYKEGEITEAVAFVYEMSAPASEKTVNFWDFRDQKIYTKASEKVIDFLLGFFVAGFVVWVLVWFLHLFIRASYMIASPIFYVLALIFLFKKRRYMFYGLLADLLIPLAGIIFLLFVIGGF